MLETISLWPLSRRNNYSKRKQLTLYKISGMSAKQEKIEQVNRLARVLYKAILDDTTRKRNREEKGPTTDLLQESGFGKDKDWFWRTGR